MIGIQGMRNGVHSMSKKRDSNVGWVIVHPDGHYELDYFNTVCFGTKLDGYKDEVTPEFWRDTYRPDCEIKLMKVIDIKTPA